MTPVAPVLSPPVMNTGNVPTRVQPGLLIRSSVNDAKASAPAYASSRNGNVNGRGNASRHQQSQQFYPSQSQYHSQPAFQPQEVPISDVLPVKKRTRTRKPKASVPLPAAHGAVTSEMVPHPPPPLPPAAAAAPPELIEAKVGKAMMVGMDNIQIDPILLEDDASASLIRTASLGLRDRGASIGGQAGSPRDY